MDARKFLKADRWLSLEDVALGVPGWIVEVGSTKDETGSYLWIQIQDTGGDLVKCRLNDVSIKCLIEAYGADTDDWLRKPIIVSRETIKTARGLIWAKVVKPRPDKDLDDSPPF